MSAVGILLLSFVMAFLSFMPAYQPENLVQGERYRPPSLASPMGTDGYGYGILSKIIASAGAYVVPCFLASAIALMGGVLLGSVSGYYGAISATNHGSGKRRIFSLSHLDVPIQYGLNLIDALPQLAFILLLCATVSTNFYWIAAALGAMGAAKLGGLIRSEILSLRQEDYIEAAIELGLRDRVILWRHLLLTRLRPLLVSRIFHIVADVILVETTLRFFLVSIGAENSWGKLLVDAKDRIFTSQTIRNLGDTPVHLWWLWFFPALLIVVDIIAFYLLADVAAQGRGHRA